MTASHARRLRCAVYTRKSTEEGLDQAFNSLDAQREACSAYVLSQQHEGWVLAPEFYDDGGYSGGTLNRPGLVQLLGDVKAGRIDVIVVYKIDRLTRSLADFAKIVEVLDGANASFVSVTQAFNTTTSIGRLTLNVLLSFAQFEREVIAERIRDKIAASKARGMWTGGPVPLGYKVENRKLVVVEDEAATVRSIMKRYLAAASVQHLQAELARDGIVSKRVVLKDGSIRGGSPFRRGALFWLLSNPVYLGKIRHKDKVYEGEHQGIVDPELYDAVQAKLAMSTNSPRSNLKLPSGPSFNPMTPRKVRTLLAGMVFDAQGRPMSPCHTRNHGRRYRYYASNLANGCGAPAQRLPAGELDRSVREAIFGLLRDQALLGSLASQTSVEARGKLFDSADSLARSLESSSISGLRQQLLGFQAKVIVSNRSASLSLDILCLFSSCGIAVPGRTDVTLDLPIVERPYGHEQRLRLDPPPSTSPKRRSKLLHLMGRAFVARRRLLTMTGEDCAAVPEAELRHLERTARLAYLDPSIVRAILSGTEPVEHSPRSLWRMPSLPITWNEQRQLLQFEVA